MQNTPLGVRASDSDVSARRVMALGAASGFLKTATLTFAAVMIEGAVPAGYGVIIAPQQTPRLNCRGPFVPLTRVNRFVGRLPAEGGEYRTSSSRKKPRRSVEDVSLFISDRMTVGTGSLNTKMLPLRKAFIVTVPPVVSATLPEVAVIANEPEVVTYPVDVAELVTANERFSPKTIAEGEYGDPVCTHVPVGMICLDTRPLA